MVPHGPQDSPQLGSWLNPAVCIGATAQFSGDYGPWSQALGPSTLNLALN